MKNLIGTCLVYIIVFLAIMLFNAWILELLWNWLAPIFWSSAPILTYWESVGINIFLIIIAGLFRGVVVSRK